MIKISITEFYSEHKDEIDKLVVRIKLSRGIDYSDNLIIVAACLACRLNDEEDILFDIIDSDISISSLKNLDFYKIMSSIYGEDFKFCMIFDCYLDESYYVFANKEEISLYLPHHTRLIGIKSERVFISDYTRTIQFEDCNSIRTFSTISNKDDVDGVVNFRGMEVVNIYNSFNNSDIDKLIFSGKVSGYGFNGSVINSIVFDRDLFSFLISMENSFMGSTSMIKSVEISKELSWMHDVVKFCNVVKYYGGVVDCVC